MPLRLLGYMLEIYRQHQAAHGLPLPPVLPFVLHQGPDTWTSSLAFEDLFELPEEVAADLLPFLPKFQHALLDLSRYNPAQDEEDVRQRVVLHLMKLAREHQLLAYFRWLAETLAERLPDSLLTRMLVYALHVDSNIDEEQIYRNLSANPELERQAMSVAEKLITKGRAQGRTEGRAEGVWIGKIQQLEELLDLPSSARESLDELSLAGLEARHAVLHREFEIRFKRS